MFLPTCGLDTKRELKTLKAGQGRAESNRSHDARRIEKARGGSEADTVADRTEVSA